MGFQGYTDGTKDAALASFESGVGLIGRAKESGSDSSPNVQELSGEDFLRLDLAQKHGVKGVYAIYVDRFDAVFELYTGEERPDFEEERADFNDGILDCFGKVIVTFVDTL